MKITPPCVDISENGLRHILRKAGVDAKKSREVAKGYFDARRWQNRQLKNEAAKGKR